MLAKETLPITVHSSRCTTLDMEAHLILSPYLFMVIRTCSMCLRVEMLR
jgi:hypothetical protein